MSSPPAPPPPPPVLECAASASCNSGCGEMPSDRYDPALLGLPPAEAGSCYFCDTYLFSDAPDWCTWRWDAPMFESDLCCVKHECTGACAPSPPPSPPLPAPPPPPPPSPPPPRSPPGRRRPRCLPHGPSRGPEGRGRRRPRHGHRRRLRRRRRRHRRRPPRRRRSAAAAARAVRRGRRQQRLRRDAFGVRRGRETADGDGGPVLLLRQVPAVERAWLVRYRHDGWTVDYCCVSHGCDGGCRDTPTAPPPPSPARPPPRRRRRPRRAHAHPVQQRLWRGAFRYLRPSGAAGGGGQLLLLRHLPVR